MFSTWHLLLLALVVLLLFGGSGKISSIMGDFAKGIKSFKKGMADDEEPPAGARGDNARVIEHREPKPDASRTSETTKTT